MRIYISGPITGRTDYMRRFNGAEAIWNDQGIETVNPAKINAHLPETTTHKEYMVTSIALLKICDTIYLLNDWESSKGARREYRYAKNHGYQILYEGRCNALMGEKG